jgi:uncharacterized protein YbjT (DUF2867 family)
MQTREFDIALLGATGFTGRLIAAYLVRHAHTHGYRVALAGRNEARGQALIADLQRSGRPSTGLGWITADVEDEASLARLASRDAPGHERRRAIRAARPAGGTGLRSARHAPHRPHRGT